MSELDVHRIICPYRERELERLRERMNGAEQIVLVLRRRLRELDPSLPFEYDGNAWEPFEALMLSTTNATTKPKGRME